MENNIDELKESISLLEEKLKQMIADKKYLLKLIKTEKDEEIVKESKIQLEEINEMLSKFNVNTEDIKTINVSKMFDVVYQMHQKFN